MDILDCVDVDDLPSGMLEELKRSVAQQQKRQIRRIELLKKQASLTNEQQFLWAQKQHAEMKRLQNVERETSRRKEIETFHQKLVNQRREAVLLASQKEYESRRRALLKRLQEADRRAEKKCVEKTNLSQEATRKSLEASLKRERVKKESEYLFERRCRERQRKLERLDIRARQIEEHREMDNELRLRNEHAKQLMQEDACARRNYQLENKINTLATKQRERDQLLERRKQEFEHQLHTRLENSLRRSEYSASKLLEKTQRDEGEQSYRLQKFQDKIRRSDRIQQQKAQVHQALHDFRLEMNLQENMLKDKLHDLERTGRHDLLDLDATLFCATLGRSTFKTCYPTRRRPLSAHPTVMREDNTKKMIAQTKSVPTEWQPEELNAVDADNEHDGLLDPEDCGLKSNQDVLRETFKIEVYNEMQRQNTLAKVQDPDEFQRLLRIFETERKQSMNRIHNLTCQ